MTVALLTLLCVFRAILLNPVVYWNQPRLLRTLYQDSISLKNNFLEPTPEILEHPASQVVLKSEKREEINVSVSFTARGWGCTLSLCPRCMPPRLTEKGKGSLLALGWNCRSLEASRAEPVDMNPFPRSSLKPCHPRVACLWSSLTPRSPGSC